MRFIPLFALYLAACLLCIDTTGGLSIHWLTASTLTAFLISWPTVHLPQQLLRIVQFVVGELFIGVCLADCFCQEFFATPITPQILSNMLLSNVSETNGFFSSFVGFYVLYHWRITTILLLGILLPFVLLFKCKPVKVSNTVRKITAAFLSLCLIYEIPTIYRYGQLFFHCNDLQKMEGLIFRHYHEEIPTPPHRLAFAWYSLKLSSQQLANIKHATLSAQIDSCTHLSPHIVLVIGESYNKHHSALYGYQLPTTPLQQKRLDDGELYVFHDAVTPWNITSNVFLDLFSVWEYGMSEPIATKPLFPLLFRRAGYSVNFFSNQYLLKGFHKGATNQAGHFFLADGEMSNLLFTFRNRKASKYDMGLVGQVSECKFSRKQTECTLDIIHLIGQHFDYSMRYPPTSAKFSIGNYNGRNIDKKAKEIVMHYDNATYYNDLVVDSLLALYENDDAIVIYVADHGEEVYDDLPIHGRLFQEPTAAQARQEFEVPMWIWCSESYRRNHSDVVQCIKHSLDQPFMTDGLPQVLLSLAGITSIWNDESKNILSLKYQCGKRIICGTTDFDRLVQ